jgi:hypothetical protein
LDDYIDNFSATFRICTPWTSEAPPRMAQATWTASVISSTLDPFSKDACVGVDMVGTLHGGIKD